MLDVIYTRVNNRVAHNLNSQPTTISLALNEGAGEITYNLEFNNRPVNLFTGVISETININDTYPGDTFAVVQFWVELLAHCYNILEVGQNIEEMLELK